MNRVGWLVLYVGYQPPSGPQPPDVSPLEIQKGLFLLRQVAELADDEAYDFKPFDFGPVSPEIYSDIDKLTDAELIKASRPGPNKRFCYYQATDAGRATANDLAQKANPMHLLYLEVIRSLLKELTFAQVVAAMYAAYPEYSVATTAHDLLPGAARGARKELATLLTPEEIRFRADTLRGMRQIENGRYLTRRQMKSALKNGA